MQATQLLPQQDSTQRPKGYIQVYEKELQNTFIYKYAEDYARVCNIVITL